MSEPGIQNLSLPDPAPQDDHTPFISLCLDDEEDFHLSREEAEGLFFELLTFGFEAPTGLHDLRSSLARRLGRNPFWPHQRLHYSSTGQTVAELDSAGMPPAKANLGGAMRVSPPPHPAMAGQAVGGYTEDK